MDKLDIIKELLPLLANLQDLTQKLELSLCNEYDKLIKSKEKQERNPIYRR